MNATAASCCLAREVAKGYTWPQMDRNSTEMDAIQHLALTRIMTLRIFLGMVVALFCLYGLSALLQPPVLSLTLPRDTAPHLESSGIQGSP